MSLEMYVVLVYRLYRVIYATKFFKVYDLLRHPVSTRYYYVVVRFIESIYTLIYIPRNDDVSGIINYA